jgi:hypothetical protein
VTASWHDGYHHYVLTVDPRLLTEHAHHASVPASTGPGPGAVSSAGTPSSGPSTPSTGPSSTAPGNTAPSNGWQADAYNPVYPVVWRPGQPTSVLLKGMRAFPKGTAIQRDANGDIQAVIDVHP